MSNKLSLTIILTPLLLAIWLAGCDEEEALAIKMRRESNKDETDENPYPPR